MSATFNKTCLIRREADLKSPSENCPICWTSLNEYSPSERKVEQVGVSLLGHRATESVYHLSHEKCFTEWSKQKMTCPYGCGVLRDEEGILQAPQGDLAERFQQVNQERLLAWIRGDYQDFNADERELFPQILRGAHFVRVEQNAIPYKEIVFVVLISILTAIILRTAL